MIGELWLAPLAGLTDNAFRQVAKECGAQVLVSEMVSSEGLVRNSGKTLALTDYNPAQQPYGIQLFGANPDNMASAAKICLELSPAFIDINMGCPVKKVVKRGAGSALMQNPALAASIVQAVKAVMPATMALSVKFRAGWDADSINCVEFGTLMEEAGADVLVLHARTRAQMYSGLADWNLITALKKAVRVPVVGNGDVTDPGKALQMRNQTGCDAVMIGRGALGRPWIFEEITKYNLTGTTVEIDSLYKLKVVTRHLQLSVEEKGERAAVTNMRAHLCHYTRGCRNGAEVRRRINACQSSALVLSLIKELYDQG